jgi:pimeloyl-ACP methyl ester carboxylesterase
MRQFTDARTGLRVRVRDHDGTPACLLIHGMGGGLSNWVPLERRLIAPTVAVELPWHGRSRPSRPCLSADDVVALVAEAAFRAHPGPFVAIGHSLGGSIAMTLAALAPERITDVVLVSGHLFTLAGLIAGTGPGDRALRVALWRARLTAATPMLRPVRAGLSRSARLRAAMLPPFMNPALIGADSLLGDCLADHTGRGTRRIYRLSRLVALDDVARNCPAPVTIIEGGRDPLLRPADTARAHQLLRVRKHIVLPDCAHWILVERPDALAAEISRLGIPG